MFGKIVKLPGILIKPFRMAILIVVFCFGAYSLLSSNTLTMIIEPFQFAQASEGKTRDGAKTEHGTNEGDKDSTLIDGNENHPTGGKRTVTVSPGAVLNTVATYASIMGMLAMTTSFTEKRLKGSKN
jgi:hypothetical protein